VVIGLDVELAARTETRSTPRGCTRLVAAVRDNNGARRDHQGAGGGARCLFNRHSARYLALVVTTLPQKRRQGCRGSRHCQVAVVLKSRRRRGITGRPSTIYRCFGAFWERFAEMQQPREGSTIRPGAVQRLEIPERDLSVQLRLGC